MRFLEAIEKVGEIYTPGAAAYFSRQTPDRWQKMHDDLERIILMGNPEIEAVGCDHFVAKAEELIREFESKGRPSAGVSPADAFILGSERRVEHWTSRKHKMCSVCDSKENLKLRSSPSNHLGVEIICQSCSETEGWAS